MVDYHGLLNGYDTEAADAEQAYVQADLGRTQCDSWIEIPEEFWEGDWKGKYRRPCCQLIKALYGHADSGGHCEQHAEEG